MRVIVLVFALLLSAPAFAQILEADKARYAINLFSSICHFGQGRPEGPAEYVEFRLRPLVADAQRFFLNGRTGKAWASDVPFGSFAVALSDDGECLVHVRRLTGSQAEHFFKGAVNLLGEKVSVEAKPAFKLARPYGEDLILQYAFRSQFNGLLYEVELKTTDSADAPIQATFSSRIKK